MANTLVKREAYMINTDKEYTFEEILAMLPEETEKSRVIDKFIEHLKESLEFIKTTGAFKTVDMQRYLRCGYGDTCRVIDALLLLGVAKKTDAAPSKYIITIKEK